MMLHRSRLRQLNLIMTVIGLMHKPFILQGDEPGFLQILETLDVTLLCSHSIVLPVSHGLAVSKKNVLR